MNIGVHFSVYSCVDVSREDYKTEELLGQWDLIS